MMMFRIPTAGELRKILTGILFFAAFLFLFAPRSRSEESAAAPAVCLEIPQEHYFFRRLISAGMIEAGLGFYDREKPAINSGDRISHERKTLSVK